MSRLIPILLIFLTLFILPTLAQDEPACDLTFLLDELDATVTILPKLTDEGIMKTLMQMESLISRTRAQCAGYTFTSEDEGLQPVIGPLEFANGIYLARITTEGFIAGKVTELNGLCGDSSYLFNEGSGDAVDGAERIFETSENCSMLLELSNVSAPWTLEFEPIKLD